MKEEVLPGLEFAVNACGQIFKVLALVYLFRALVEEVLKKPYRNLFQQHNYSQHKLIVSASFLSTMVHDLKNPLANIRALCQLSKIAKTEEKREANLNKIINNVDQLTDMLNKIMDTIREDKFIECDLENVISEVIEEIRPVCVTRDIQLTYQLDKDIPVLLERSMFKRAIYNILKNAIDAIEESGKLSIYLEKKWNKALVIIKDNGPGIPEEIQGSLFQPFVSSKGTGLGLYMVDFTITQIHKGKVWFDTFKGKGTTFYIELPLLKNNPIFNMGTYLLGRS